MTTQSDRKGRTFWDILVEFPKTSISLFIFLVIAVVCMFYLLTKSNYSIKSNIGTLEPSKFTASDTIATKQNNTSNNNYYKEHTLSSKIPKTNKSLSQKNEKEAITTAPPLPQINVTSHNQSGGITANEVFIGKIQRELHNSEKNELLSFIEKDEKVYIQSLLGDNESFNLANQILDFLKSFGYTNIELLQVIFSKPVVGQYINRDSLGVTITIGSNSN